MLHEIREHPRGNIGHDLASPPDSRTVPSLPNRSQLIATSGVSGPLNSPRSFRYHRPSPTDLLLGPAPSPFTLSPYFFFSFLLSSFVVLDRVVRRRAGRKIRNPSMVFASSLPSGKMRNLIVIHGGERNFWLRAKFRTHFSIVVDKRERHGKF